MSDQELSVFVGTDRSQAFAVDVLAHSIRRHTQASVRVVPLDNDTAGIRPPNDFRHGARTGFSFVRFAIPGLMNHQGRALYLDADMLVFHDLLELWNSDFAGHDILIVGDVTGAPGRGRLLRRRIRQCSVMLIDCEACHWDANRIVAGLGVDYSYEDLMYRMCFVPPERIGDTLPFTWNSLETWTPETRLIHYTDMLSQPWVDPANSNGYLWVNELRMMLNETPPLLEKLEHEVEIGYLRPSLLTEVSMPIQSQPLSESRVREFLEIDVARSYRKHARILDERRARIARVRKLENEMSMFNLLTVMPSRESRHPVTRFRYLLNTIMRG